MIYVSTELQNLQSINWLYLALLIPKIALNEKRKWILIIQ